MSILSFEGIVRRICSSIAAKDSSDSWETRFGCEDVEPVADGLFGPRSHRLLVVDVLSVKAGLVGSVLHQHPESMTM